ncbi:MAG: hypothetical protein V3R96_07070 [Dehalococcoidales bacterium]
MTRWKLKSCPKCRGDVYIERELGNWYARCLQCGHQQYLSNMDQKHVPLAKKKSKALIR